MSTVPLAIVGNALAGMVCATERARRGLPTLLINPGGPWGGYFAGLQAGGQRWDMGTVLYEFTSFRTPAEPPALASYDPLRRNDIGRFTHAVQAYVAAHQPAHDIVPLQMWTGAHWLPDLLLGNGLDALPRLSCAAAAREELRAIVDAVAHSPWHARRKNDWPEHGPESYELVSRLNHGAVLHDAVFAPFARQVLDRDSGHIAALFHRIPWLPLYWPETLLTALEGRPTGLPPTVYSHPRGACVADLCASLVETMRTEPLIRLCEERVRSVERDGPGYAVQLERSGRIAARRLAWAQTPRQALAACGADMPAAVEERLPLTLALLRLPSEALRREFSVAHLAAADTGLYRVSHVSHCAGETGAEVRLAVEAHPSRLEAHHGPTPDDASLVQAMLRDLAQVGLVAPDASAGFAQVLRLPGALPLPTPASMAAYAQERALMLQSLPGIEPLAASAGPYATSLSDQIVQGLQLAEADAPPMPIDEATAPTREAVHA